MKKVLEKARSKSASPSKLRFLTILALTAALTLLAGGTLASCSIDLSGINVGIGKDAERTYCGYFSGTFGGALEIDTRKEGYVAFKSGGNGKMREYSIAVPLRHSDGSETWSYACAAIYQIGGKYYDADDSEVIFSQGSPESGSFCIDCVETWYGSQRGKITDLKFTRTK